MTQQTRNIYKDIMDVLEKHAELEKSEYQYVNPNFLIELTCLLDNYGKLDTSYEVDMYIKNMWGC